MPNLAHIWFDVDNTLYRQTDELKEKIMHLMYERAAMLLGQTPGDIARKYDTIFKETESHSATFEKMKLPGDEARIAYSSANIAGTLTEDQKLIDLFDYIERWGIPCSTYSNSFSGDVDSILQKLGLADKQRFKFMIPGEAYPKTRNEGFKRMLELSAALAQKEIPTSNLLMVGDREKTDTIPAKNLGMLAARVVWTRDVSKIQSAADFILPDIYALKNVVDKLER